LESEIRCFPLKLPLGSNAPRDAKLTIINALSINTPIFLDYIAGGTQINLVVAIDFTESNKDPSMPFSLHYIGEENGENDYQQAIRSVGTIYEVFINLIKVDLIIFRVFLD